MFVRHVFYKCMSEKVKILFLNTSIIMTHSYPKQKKNMLSHLLLKLRLLYVYQHFSKVGLKTLKNVPDWVRVSESQNYRTFLK